MNGERPDRLSPENVRACLAAYLDRNDRTQFPWITKPENVELGVAYPLYEARRHYCLCDHTIKAHQHHQAKRLGTCHLCPCQRYQTAIAFAGRIDILGQLREDPRVACPVDHKTSGKVDARFVQQYTLDSQLSGYKWLASHIVKQPAHTLVSFINAIELSVLPSSDRKCPTHGVLYSECGPEHVKFQIIGPIERTKQQIAEWRETAIVLALAYRRLLHETPETIHAVRTEGTFNSGCSYCEFREWCLADRPAKQVPHMFTRNDWNVRAHVGIDDGEHWTANPKVFTVDNSILRSAASCSTQVLMRYGLSFSTPEQSMPLAAGISVHAALEVWFKGGTVEAALHKFDKTYTA